MNNEKRLVYLFKTFAEKVFLPQCSKSDIVMNDWNKFLNLLSPQTINLNEVQSYIDSIGSSPQINTLLMQSQQSVPVAKKEDYYNHAPIYNRKKQETIQFDTPQQINFNPSKTFGGEKVKIPMYQNKQEFDEMGRKQFASNLNTNSNKQEAPKYRNTTNLTSVYKEVNIDNAPIMLASLQKLYKNLVQNQQKIEALTQINPQGVGGLGNPSYF